MPAETRFLADVMLGKLATWLRLLGCDVEYFRNVTDEELVAKASLSGRVLLTRDAGLVRRRLARNNHFFVRGNDFREQLRQVAERFSIEPSDRILTRCLRCNESLEAIDRTVAREQVPTYVYATARDFKTCDRCGRIYWNGTHRDKALAELLEIFGPGGTVPGSDRPTENAVIDDSE